jgi:putative DNA primase/helicase
MNNHTPPIPGQQAPPAAHGKTDPAEEAFREGQRAGAECLEAALAYLARGWSALAVCPPDHVGVGKTHARKCKHPGKAPWGPWKEFQGRLPTEDEIRQKWRDNSLLNVGIALGGVTGLIGLDVDESAGEELLRRLSKGDLPPTLEFISGKGRRLLYRVPAGVELRPTPKPGGEEVEGGELRLLGLGSMSVAPPSRHKDSGRRYAWVPGRGPGEIVPCVAPAWVVELMRADAPGADGKARGRRARPFAAAEKIREKHRNTTLTSLAGTMRRRGLDAEEILAALLVVNARRCEPPLDEKEVEGIARSVAGYDPADPFWVTAASGTAPEGTAASIILAQLRTKYQPTFRRGDAYYSAVLGREVKRSEACFGADSDLIKQLAQATDAPRHDDGTVKWSALPRLYKTWVPTAHTDLLAGLPEEEESGAEVGVVEPARGEFRARVAAALHQIVTIGQTTYEDKKEVTRTERHSLIELCDMWAKPGNWEQVRSYLLWLRREKDTAPLTLGRLRVALRVELFAQGPARDLARLDQRKFGRLAQLYDVGVDGECRAGGARCVELTPEFIAELLDRPQLTDCREETSHACARENDDFAST